MSEPGSPGKTSLSAVRDVAWKHVGARPTVTQPWPLRKWLVESGSALSWRDGQGYKQQGNSSLSRSSGRGRGVRLGALHRCSSAYR